MKTQLEKLHELAYKISICAMEIDIEPSKIAVRLPNDYWYGALSDKEFMHKATYHPESSISKFQLRDITFYNDRSMPDWMKP